MRTLEREPTREEWLWLQRYLRGELDAEARAWFEALLLTHGGLIAALERCNDLRDGAALACSQVDAAVPHGGLEPGAGRPAAAGAPRAARAAGGATPRASACCRP